MAQIVNFQTTQTLLLSIAVLILLFPLRPAAYFLTFHQDRLVYHWKPQKQRVWVKVSQLQHYWHFGPYNSFVVETVLCIVGHVAHPWFYPLYASSTKSLSRLGQPTMSPGIPKYPLWGAKWPRPLWDPRPKAYVSLPSNLLLSPQVPPIEEVLHPCMHLVSFKLVAYEFSLFGILKQL